MHITIIALGSRGDILPLAILGQGLRRAGFEVRLATFENYEPMVAAHDLEFYRIRGDARALLNGASGQALARSGRNFLRAFSAAMRSFGALAREYARDLSDPALFETDAIINQLPVCLYGYDLAEKLDLPLFTAAVIPMTRTRSFPVMGFPTQPSAVPGYNAVSYRLAEQLLWQAYRPTISDWRKRALGLKGAPFWGYFSQMAKRPVPVLNGFSERVVPRPIDWGEHVHVTGYWFPDEEAWQPPEDLVHFLNEGPPPVFVGFGSMPVPNPAQVSAMIVEALERCELRGVLLSGWGQLADRQLPDHIYRLEYAPFSWLFPRMAAVVHHGGSGTTAAGLRAGVPAVVVPFLFDQYFWGDRLAELGVAPPSLPFNRLSVRRLVDAIGSAAHDHNLRQHAAKLGCQIRSENGLHCAVELVQQYLGI